MNKLLHNLLNFRKPQRVIIYTLAVLAVMLSVGFVVNKITDGSILDSILPMSMDNVVKEPHFAGTVSQVQDNTILIKVKEDEDVRRSSDLISVSLNVKLKDSMTRFTVGDEVIVYYNGEIAESYPAQVHTVYAIVLTSPDMRIYEGSELEMKGKPPMTLEDVRNLAKKGDDLLFEDLQQFQGANVSSNLDYNIMLYGVERGYRLIVHSGKSGKPDSVSLESIWESGGSGIDIRYGDLDEFLSKWPIIMLVKDGTVTPSGITITLKNVTDSEYTYGEDYTVQKKTEQGWIDVEPVLENYGFNSIGYLLPAKGSEEIDIDWEWLYGKLPAGDYRIAKEALLVRSPGEYDTFPLYAAFTITE